MGAHLLGRYLPDSGIGKLDCLHPTECLERRDHIPLVPNSLTKAHLLPFVISDIHLLRGKNHGLSGVFIEEFGDYIVDFLGR